MYNAQCIVNSRSAKAAQSVSGPSARKRVTSGCPKQSRLKKWGNWLRVFFIIHYSLSITHFAQAQSLVGSWVGVGRQIDSGFVCPLPVYLQVRSDSTYTLDLIDRAAAAPRSTWAFSGGWLRLDTAIFLPEQVRLTATELHINGAVPMQFWRVEPTTVPISEEPVRALLINRVWAGLSGKRYHFHQGGQACIEYESTGDRDSRCWTIAVRDGAVFIVVKGNRIDCSRNYDAPMQVLGNRDNQLIVKLLLPNETQVVDLTAGKTLPPGKDCAAIGFQLCSSCLHVPYEQADAFDKKGPPGRFYAVRQRLLADYKPVNVPAQTGIVQVRCLVNCEGQAGQFTAITYSSNYQQTQFDGRIVNQLLTIMRTYFATGWKPGRIQKIDRPLDYQATVNIRLVAGVITDVYP